MFTELNLITRDLKNRQLDSLHEWCEKYKNLLNDMKSKLYFECIRLKYILLLNNKELKSKDCVTFAKKEFKPFLKNQECYEEISKLMTALIFKDNPLNKNPYKDMDVEALWIKVTSMFINDCCTILSKKRFLIII